MKELVFKVSFDEANLILEGLGHLQFARVYALVEKIQQQAREQLKGEPELGATEASGLSAAPAGAAAKGASNGQ